LIKRKPGFSGKMFWSLEIPFKTGFTVYEKELCVKLVIYKDCMCYVFFNVFMQAVWNAEAKPARLLA